MAAKGDSVKAILFALGANFFIFVTKLIAAVITKSGAMMAEAVRPPKDAKTALQEWAQGKGLPLPAYALVERSGPDHDPTFTVAAELRGLPRATASGKSKRAAEQLAAQALLRLIHGRETE